MLYESIPENKHVTFILGGVHSGKSLYAEKLVQRIADTTNGHVLYVPVTDKPLPQMVKKARKSQRFEGPSSWVIAELSLQLGEKIEEIISRNETDVVYVDGLDSWVTQVLARQIELNQKNNFGQAMRAEVLGLKRCIDNSSCQWVLVSTEVGLGGVESEEVEQTIRENAVGDVHQALADEADEAIFIVAGRPISLTV